MLNQRRVLRDILRGDRCVVASSVFDPISARIGDELGFQVGLMGGSVASFAVLGAPDLLLITLTELAEQVRRTCRAGELSVIVDADHGYGNALNVMRTATELEHAGAAGITIEDTLLPRPFDAPESPTLVSLDEGLGKIRAAVQARGDSAMAIFARTSAVPIAGIDEALERIRAYDGSGADALFLPGLRTRAELDRIAAAVTLPLFVATPDESLMDLEYLTSRGVRLCATGHQPFWAAVQGLYDALKAVRGGTLASQLQGVAPAPLMNSLLRSSSYKESFDAFGRR